MSNGTGLEPTSQPVSGQPQVAGTGQQPQGGMGSVEGQGTGGNQQPLDQEKKTHEAELMSRWQKEQAARTQLEVEKERLERQVKELESAQGDAMKVAQLKAQHQTENLVAENIKLKIDVALQNAPLVQKAIAAGKVDPANFQTPEQVLGAEEVIKSMLEANMPTQQPNSQTPAGNGNTPANQAPSPSPEPQQQPPQGMGPMSPAPQGAMSEEQERQVDMQDAVKNKSMKNVVKKWFLGDRGEQV